MSAAADRLGGAPRVSVIVPTFNRAKMVCSCVASVLAEEDSNLLEVIVIDDCSPDDTKARVAAQFGGDARVRYFRNARNSFQAVSRNNGAKVARGDYLFFLDDDNLVAPTVLAELLDCFARHPDAGLVAPLSVNRRSGGDGLVWTLGSDFSHWTSRPKDRGGNLPLAALPAEPIDYPTTYSPNAFMVPRRLYEELGGMDERFVQIFEESDFGWRIVEGGHSAWIATRARTEHLGFLEPGCVPALRLLGIEKPYRTYCFARNRVRFARRHFRFFPALSVAFVFAPLSAVWYGCVALKNRRPDIAWAYLKGTLAGIVGA